MALIAAFAAPSLAAKTVIEDEEIGRSDRGGTAKNRPVFYSIVGDVCGIPELPN